MCIFKKPRLNFRANGGSAIVGVLAALTFIGLVVAAMVRNTGAQAANSGGYASALTMHSTARSGIVATESFFLNNGGGDGMGLAFINKVKNGAAGADDSVIYGKGNRQAELSAKTGQYFSSKLKKLSPVPGAAAFNSDFEVAAGKKPTGKEARKARAFYRLDNLAAASQGAPVANAIFSAGPVNNADAGMNVTGGGATFLDNVSFQNYPSAFEKSAYFGGNTKFTSGNDQVTFKDKAYFAKEAEFKGAATFDGAACFGGDKTEFNKTVAFNDNAYFDKTAVFQNTVGTEFKKNVGFNGAIQTNDQLSVCKNVYMNGNFANSYNGKINKTGGAADDTLFYTDGNIADTARFVGFSNKKNSGAGIDAPGKLNLGMDGMKDSLRRDPQLNISNIPQSIIKSAAEAMTGNPSGGNFDINKLNSAYGATPTSELYNGEYLVVRVERNKHINFTSMNPGTFNNKIIIIIEDGATLNAGTRFYTSGANSNTLVYAGPGNAQLEQFGADGLFRGFIYIDALNTAQNSIQFRGNGRIQGAVHNFSKKPLGWNGGANLANKAIPIDFDADALNGFGSLYPSAAGTPGAGDISVISGKQIDIRPLGYYFYP
jgi:hypothetical protein